MKIHPYSVRLSEGTQPLVQVLDHIRAENISMRLRTVGPELKAEDILTRNGLYYMDFVRMRFRGGPGRASRTAQIQGFQFQRDEAFGEETAALYDPGTGFIFVQYKHEGIKAAHIAQYLSNYIPTAQNNYEFHACLDPDVLAKLRRKRIFRKIDFTVASGPVTHRERQQGVSMKRALVHIGESGAQSISVSVSMAHEHTGMDRSWVNETLNLLRSNISGDQGSVSTLRVYAKDDPTTPTEILDLIANRLYKDYELEPSAVDLRYPRDARYHLLETARTELAPHLRHD